LAANNDDLEALRAEIDRLRDENARLLSLLDGRGTRYRGTGSEDRVAPTDPLSLEPSERPSALSTAEKVALFRKLFCGRSDVFPVRWESSTGRSGYAPACANEWKPGVCEKPRIKCIEIDATQFRTIPRRGYHIRGRRIRLPGNYNPLTREYNGVWDGVSWQVAYSNNPRGASTTCCETPATALGRRIPEAWLDKWTFYTIGQHCDGLVPDGKGGLEPRFTCNAYIQTAREAYQLVKELCSVFRGMDYWASGAVTVTQDAPADPFILYTPANVVGGAFEYEGSARAARHTVAIV
jgi:hypothetical protein